MHTDISVQLAVRDRKVTRVKVGHVYGTVEYVSYQSTS